MLQAALKRDSKRKRRKPSATFLAIKRWQRTKIWKVIKLARSSKKSGLIWDHSVKLLRPGAFPFLVCWWRVWFHGRWSGCRWQCGMVFGQWVQELSCGLVCNCWGPYGNVSWKLTYFPLHWRLSRHSRVSSPCWCWFCGERFLLLQEDGCFLMQDMD